MITIPLWLFVILSILSAIGGMALLLTIYAYMRVKQYENEKDNEIAERLEKNYGTREK